MKRLMTLFAMLFVLSATSVFAYSDLDITEAVTLANQQASITFRNKSDYTLTLKICHLYGGTYSMIELGPKSSRTVSFGKTATFNLKIKATKYGQSSYHDGGGLSVTCNEYEWTEGEMVFQMSSYGSGLGPSISRAEFESDR